MTEHGPDRRTGESHRTHDARAARSRGGGGVLATITVAVVLAIGAACSDQDGPETNTPASSAPTQTLSPTQPAGPKAAVDPLEGVDVVPLTYQTPTAADETVPAGVIVYFTQVRPASDSGHSGIWRAYRNSRGDLQFDDLTAPLRERTQHGGGPYSLVISEDGATIMAAVCVEQPSCGVEVRRPAGSEEVILAAMRADPEGLAFRSTDGGASWTEAGVLPSGDSFAAVLPQGTIVAERSGQSTAFRWFESGDPIDPPFEDAWPSVVHGGGLVWAPGSFGPEPFTSHDGSVLQEQLFAAESSEDLVGITTGGDRIVLARSGEDAEAPWLFVTVSPSGEVVQAVSGDWFLRGQLAQGFDGVQLVAWGRVGGNPDHLPYLIDPGAGTATPMLELTQFVAEGLSPLVVRTVGYGAAPLRVRTPGDCLNVRAEPSAEAEVVACAADGTLLRDLGEEQDGRLLVTTPDGTEGWVAFGFIVR